MTVTECKARMPLLEFHAWTMDEIENYNRPSRADYYMMKVAAEIRRLYKLRIKDRTPSNIEDFKLKVEVPKSKSEIEQEKQDMIRMQTAAAKAAWAARIRMAKRHGNDR